APARQRSAVCDACPVISFGQRSTQLCRQIAEGVRNNRGAGYHRHEIGVAIPTRHDVDVYMLDDAGAGDLAQVNADVESVRFHHLCQGVLATAGQKHEVPQLLIGEVVEVGSLFVRHGHQVSAGVGVSVQE